MSNAAVYKVTFLRSIKNRTIFQRQNNYPFVLYTINLMLKKKFNSNMSTCYCDIKLYKVINVIDLKKIHYCIILLFDRL